MSRLLKRNKKLKIVRLDNNQIGDAGAQALARALEETIVQKIDLSWNRLTHASTQHIYQLCLLNSNLKYVNLKNNQIKE